MKNRDLGCEGIDGGTGDGPASALPGEGPS